MKGNTMLVGIIGAGWIAEKAAVTLKDMNDCLEYAIADIDGRCVKSDTGMDLTYVETLQVPPQITGYEYEFEACREALLEGLLEPREMPHRETLYIM